MDDWYYSTCFKGEGDGSIVCALKGEGDGSIVCALKGEDDGIFLYALKGKGDGIFLYIINSLIVCCKKLSVAHISSLLLT